MLVADGEDAGGDGGGRRLPVAGRGQTRRRAGRGAGAVVGGTDEDRVQETALPGRRQPLVMQQKNQIGKRRLLHQLEDVVSANSDVVRAGVDNRGAPGVHSSAWMLRPCRVWRGVLR